MIITNENFLREEIAFYNRLNDKEKAILSEEIHTKKFSKGEQVHSESSSCLGVLIIKSGRLRIYMLSLEGREITLYYLEKGDTCILSAGCVLSNISFEVHIEADEDTIAIQIPSSIFGRLKEQNIYVENYALKVASERFSDVMWAMQQMLFLSMEKRLEIYLHDESIKIDSLELIITHEQIAKILGSAREVITRLLQQFVKRGMLELARGRIIILDKKELTKLTE